MPEETKNSDNQNASLPPPQGTSDKGEKYIERLVNLINQEKIKVIRTDLKKFDPSALEDHYRLDLENYQIEVSHSKQPDSGKDSFIMLFTNVKNIRDGCSEKLILAYIHLNEAQYHRFREVANDQIEKIRRREEEKRFNSAIQPIDHLLNRLQTTDRPEPSPNRMEMASDQPEDNSYPLRNNAL